MSRSTSAFQIDLKSNFSGSGGAYLYNWSSYWAFQSDRCLKTNIVDAESVLDRVMAVQIRRFRWKTAHLDVPPQLGVIAQELQPLFPDLVEKSPPSDVNNEYPDGVLTVASAGFGPIAIKAIQELKLQHDAKISGLEKVNGELRKEIDLLKANAVAASNQADQVQNLMQEMAQLKKLMTSAEKTSRAGDSPEIAGKTGPVVE